MCSLLIVQLSYSLPELMIVIVTTFQGNPDLALGTVIGSSSLNILVIQGISGVIFSNSESSVAISHVNIL